MYCKIQMLCFFHLKIKKANGFRLLRIKCTTILQEKENEGISNKMKSIQDLTLKRMCTNNS